MIRQSLEYWELVAKFNQLTQRCVSPNVDTERGYSKKSSLASSEAHDRDNEEADLPKTSLLYILARLSKLGACDRRQLFEAFDKNWRHEVLSIIELPDETFEVVVLKTFFQKLGSQLLEVFPGCHLEHDDPTEPDEEEVKKFHYVKARRMCIEAFRKRVEHIDQTGHPIAAAFYSQRWVAVEQEQG